MLIAFNSKIFYTISKCIRYIFSIFVNAGIKDHLRGNVIMLTYTCLLYTSCIHHDGIFIKEDHVQDPRKIPFFPVVQHDLVGKSHFFIHKKTS